MKIAPRVMLPLAALMVATGLWQAADAQDDVLSHAVNQPSANWTFYGTGLKTKPIKDKAVPGEHAVEVTVAAKGANPWDIGAQSPIQKAIAKGDIVYLAIWARAPMLADGATTPLSSINVGQNSAPYAKAVEAGVQITNKWTLHTAKAVSPIDLPAGGAVVGVNLADEQHVIDLGPVFVLDFGPKMDAPKP